MADTYEKDLAQKSSLTTSDYIRVVGSDNVSYKQLVSDVADRVLQAYPTTTAVSDVQAWAQAHNGLGITQTNSSTTNLPSGVSNLYGVAWCNNYVYSTNIWCNLFWSPTNSNDIYVCRKLNSATWTAWEKMPTRAEMDALNSSTQSSLSSTSGTFDSWSAVRKNGNICSLSFRMTMTSAVSAWTAIFTLPSGYRPSTDTNLYLPVFLNGAVTYTQVQILSNGNVRLATGINNGTTFGFTAIFW